MAKEIDILIEKSGEKGCYVYTDLVCAIEIMREIEGVEDVYYTKYPAKYYAILDPRYNPEELMQTIGLRLFEMLGQPVGKVQIWT